MPPVGCRRERGQARDVAAIAPDRHGDVVVAERFIHVGAVNPAPDHPASGDVAQDFYVKQASTIGGLITCATSRRCRSPFRTPTPW